MTAPRPLADAAAALAAGDLDRAESICRSALAARRDHPPALNLLAIALHRLGRSSEAEAAATRATALAPRFPDPWNTLGLIDRAAGRHGEAVERFRAAVDREPAFVEAWINLVESLDSMGRPQEMLSALRRALAAVPNDRRLEGKLGRALALANELAESEAVLRRVIAAAPGDRAVRVDLATTTALQGRYDEAIALLETSLADDPAHTGTMINLAVLHRDAGRYPAALGWIDRAIGRSPRDPLAHFTRGVVLMGLGRLAEGWEEMEWRWRRSDWTTVWRASRRPVWSGEPLAGKRLLVWSEQGIGDAILHASMVGDLRSWADRLRIEAAPRLVPLFARSFPWAEVVAATGRGSIAEDRDVAAHVPAGSLGRFLRPSLPAFPPSGSFLRADAAVADAMRRRYRQAAGGTPVIGVSWRSTAGHFKNAPLADWQPILRARAGHFVSLQYGDTAADIAAAETATGVRVHVDPSVDPLTDLDRFAGQVAAMDLVITTSNTTAHVAGALGVPCWVMVPRGRGALWYWFGDGDRSPWYGSVRLYPQTEPFDWSGAVRRIADVLRQAGPVGAWVA